MKVFYILDSLTGSKGNGIAQQALIWSKILREHSNVEVQLVNPWDEYDYQKGDVVHLFGSSGVWFYDVAKQMREKGCKVVWSPICDNVDSPYLQRIKTFMGYNPLQLFSYPMIRKRAYGLVDKVFVRSNYEKDYINSAYSVNERLLEVIPLSISYPDSVAQIISPKEDFCLHISSLYQERKNVLRLIKAAKKYHFKLILAGNKGCDKEYSAIEKEIKGVDNIKILGYISEEEKRILFGKAKVFALPSLKEGVGIVAIDAAHFGCEIVITNVGGPKEYFGEYAYQVNPYDIDSIGNSVIEAMRTGCQPKLKEWIDEKYSQRVIASCLTNAYQNLLEK